MTAIAVHAVDPVGIVARGRAGPVREAWLAALRGIVPVRRLPALAEGRDLSDAVDLPASLAFGRVVRTGGVLADDSGRSFLVPCAERMGPSVSAALAGAVDSGRGVVALDEGAMPEMLGDRLGMVVVLDDMLPGAGPSDRVTIEAARERLHARGETDEAATVLTRAALALGIVSMRAPLLAVRVARAAAALQGRVINDDDVALAVRLVLAPRARRIPEAVETPETPERESRDGGAVPDARDLPDRVLAAIAASVPADLLNREARKAAGHGAGAAQGRRLGTRRGRPVGARRGDPRAARLAIHATLLAAAPWQAARTRFGPARDKGLRIEASDFRVVRTRPDVRTTVIFVVDASGSTAYSRLAEAKGAVEVVLARCYARRDHVGLIAFRDISAMTLLPPTPALARARRALASLPGGGKTPLASGLDALFAQAMAVRRGGGVPIGVVLADGGANVGRDGSVGRPKAAEDARAAARRLRAAGIDCIWIDPSPRPAEAARAFAAAMGARYEPLPLAGARALGRAVLDAMAA